MKKKFKRYFIISSIIQMIIGAILIIFAKDIGKYYIGFTDIFKSLSNESSNIISGVFYILVNLELLIMVLKKQPYLDKKRLEIVLEYGLSIILGLSPINIILSVISIFIVLNNTKKASKNDNSMVRSKDLPKLKFIELKKYKLIMGSLLLLAYLFLEYWWSITPIVFSLWVDQILLDLLFLILCLWLFSSPLLSNFKDLIKNFKIYMKYLWYKFLIFNITYIPVTLLVLYITNGAQSLNQTGLEANPYWYIIPSSVIWAPLVEEILFRGMLRQIFKNKTLFIIISSILFGLMHTVWEPTLYMVFIQGIPYILMGLFMSYLYAKTDNIYLNIICHMILNALGLLNMIFKL